MIRGIEHIGITVSDLKQAENFFIGALDASVLYRIVPPSDAEKFVPGKKMAPLNGEMRMFSWTVTLSSPDAAGNLPDSLHLMIF
ncbi:hypothetical protein [Pantoea sp. ME81]|uniref:hypothetical protein n=1 Tax=Pantoea sp. ME81 TaxID=2743935 RepID=UPI0015F55107|nr:hypothetical protein [Pantoea sp. ME81]